MNKIAIAAGLSLLLTVSTAVAGDFSLYSKTGYMDWLETTNGRQYIRESGPTEELGVSYTGSVSAVQVTSSVGLWGAVFAYDGVRASTMEKQEMTTGNVGTKGSVALALPVQLSKNFRISPLTAVEAEYFTRFVGPEGWLVLSVKGGLIMDYKHFCLAGGVYYPFYTRNSLDWTALGAADSYTLHPKGEITPYVETKFRFHKWEIGAFYEMKRWSASDAIPFRYNGPQNGSAISNYSVVYQPETVVNHGGVSIAYHF
jgi:hypothetical protein